MAAFVALLPSSIAVHAASTSSAYAEARISLINGFNKYNLEKIVDTLVLNKQKAADYRKAMMLVAASYQVPYFVDVTAAVYTGMA